MDVMIWIGAAITLAGFLGLVWSIRMVAKARREGLDDDALRDRLRAAMPVNIGALFLSFFGLMLVIVGVILS